MFIYKNYIQYSIFFKEVTSLHNFITLFSTETREHTVALQTATQVRLSAVNISFSGTKLDIVDAKKSQLFSVSRHLFAVGVSRSGGFVDLGVFAPGFCFSWVSKGLTHLHLE